MWEIQFHVLHAQSPQRRLRFVQLEGTCRTLALWLRYFFCTGQRIGWHHLRRCILKNGSAVFKRHPCETCFNGPILFRNLAKCSLIDSSFSWFGRLVCRFVYGSAISVAFVGCRHVLRINGFVNRWSENEMFQMYECYSRIFRNRPKTFFARNS